jgi:acetate kinase
MPGDILVLNAGSSSIKVSLFAAGPDGPQRRLSGQIEGIGTPRARAAVHRATGEALVDQRWPEGRGPRNHDHAVALIVEWLAGRLPGWTPAAVGHRVVHGGAQYSEPLAIDQAVRAALTELIPLAPLHNPHNLRAIDAAVRAYPTALQVACFDTAFHRSHPWVADTYALPRAQYDAGVRRYGFHGLSYAYVVEAMRRLAPEVARGRLIVAHLGNGASLCAIRDGQSVESTMGFTALDGLPMGTRSGQIDPGVLLYLIGERGMSAEALTTLLYHESGLLGLSGISSDMRDLLASDLPAAREAIEYFVYRARGHAGALAAALGGVDGLVFTAGIGEHAPEIRARICAGLGWLGLELDDAANAAGARRISTAASRVSAWVVPTDEERMIALHVAQMLGGT